MLKNRMKFAEIIVVILILGFQVKVKAQSNYNITEDVKKILFLGNSITYSGQYVTYVEAYLTLLYSDRQFEFINLGLPSETVSGLSEPNHANGQFPRPDLHERLNRVLLNIKPDLVFGCYGMNDGIYLPFEDTRFQKFRDGIHWLHNEVLKTGVPIIHITPPVYDPRKGEAYSNVLDIYSDWLIRCRYSGNWKVIDIHWPMKKYLEDKRLEDSSFMYAKDGVHPNEIGHWVMAKQILMFLGENEVSHKKDIQDVLSPFSNGEKVYNLISQRQEMMKDAWLTTTGHKRPLMKSGLPLNEAIKEAEILDNEIRSLLKI
ncbi:SGNH/GDSL hydrolase family protein [Arenitalea sp.]|nr:SGNH/GDSL hydrolase family protein [Algibacter sp.]MDA9069823.1 SGNH/GDSL hydrolase family protein [Algibacter sp.]